MTQSNGKKKVSDNAVTRTVDLESIPKPDSWSHRIEIFDRLWEQQQAEYNSKRTPIKVTLLDGKVMEAESWVTCPLDLAKRISNSLADKAIVARVDDKLWDLTRPLENNCNIEFLEWDDEEAREVFWHSACHILGYALERVFGAKLSVGPPLEEGGFFYEGMTDRPVTAADYKNIEAAMQELVKQKSPYQRLELTKEDALRMFSYTSFKSKILDKKVPDGTTCTVYRCGALIDPCRGPHLINTGCVKAFSICKNSSSYFEGKAENAVLQRVYGIAFPKASLLTEWKKNQEESAKRDHRVIGKQQQLFLFNEVSPGSAFWLPHGTRIYNTLMELMRKQYRSRGFQEVMSPNIYSSKLWKISGHWDKYADNMFCTTCEKEDYALKPMNCPGHCIMFASQPHSYKELPIRYADFGVLHRNELSGALTGLTRVRRFQQDDAHIFCRMDQVTDEIMSALDFLKSIYGILGFKFHLMLSTRPENKLGSEELWDQAEEYLSIGLNQFCGIPKLLPDPFHEGETFSYDGKPATVKKLKAILHKGRQLQQEDSLSLEKLRHAGAWVVNAGDGAFYGPKIDIIVEDAMHRRHQCATIQLDFNLPQRFGLKYTLPTAVDGGMPATDAETVPSDLDGGKHAKHKQQHADPQAPPPVAAGENVNPKSTYEAAVHDLGIDLELDTNQARPVMIHRAILGSLERSIAILCEHSGGLWPFWLSPRQIMVIPVSSANQNYAQAVYTFFQKEGFFTDVDLGSATLDKKIRNAETARYNFVFVVGQKEQEGGEVNIRARGEKRLGTMTQEEAVHWLHTLVNTYSADY